MSQVRHRRRAAHRIGTVLWPMLAALAVTGGCRSKSPELPRSIGEYRDRMLVTHQQATQADQDRPTALPELAAHQAGEPLARPVSSEAGLPTRQSLMTAPQITTQPAPQDVLDEIPDPIDATKIFDRRVGKLVEARQEQRVIESYQRVTKKAREYLEQFYLPTQAHLSLAECIQRALENSYAVRIAAYNPAVAQAQLVEAEAAFDTAFFLDTTWDNRDQSAASGLQGNQSDSRSISGGLRKILPTGMTASTALAHTRYQTDLQFATINPSYDTRFIATITQPLLRGFGLDYNRALINIARTDQRIAHQRFVEQVRDTLLNVEVAYWQLAQARRRVMILAETVGQNYITYKTMEDRLDLDATPVELNNALSRWKSREVQFQEAVRAVRDAEDRLKNLLNDPDLKLSEPIEIIPAETPLASPIVLDHFAEVRTALDQRTEIQQARLEIEKARIATARAKNETLPQLDLSFQYEVQGLSDSADHSWDRMATHRFRSYTLSASFSYPLGNRRARAAWRRSRLTERQAMVTLNQVADSVVEEVNAAVRALMVGYANIPPQLEATTAAQRNLRALQARTQRIDPPYLETELSTIEQLANTRSVLLQVLTDYNVALVQLERSKGTLLEYNNVVVTDELSGR